MLYSAKRGWVSCRRWFPLLISKAHNLSPKLKQKNSPRQINLGSDVKRFQLMQNWYNVVRIIFGIFFVEISTLGRHFSLLSHSLSLNYQLPEAGVLAPLFTVAPPLQLLLPASPFSPVIQYYRMCECVCVC